HLNFVASHHLCDRFFLCGIAFAFARTTAGIMADATPTLNQIAGDLVGLVDKLSEPFVTFDAKSSTYRFKFGEIDCILEKHPRSAPASSPPWIYYRIRTFYGEDEGEGFKIWIVNPSPDTQVNRDGLKKALEKFRDTPGIVMVQYDPNQ
ncbi:hypothetical protein BD309DRAFT_877619, partial [Dichomitus squalens]